MIWVNDYIVKKSFRKKSFQKSHARNKHSQFLETYKRRVPRFILVQFWSWIKKGFVLSVDSRDRDYSTLLSKIQLNDSTSCWKGNPGSSRLLP